MSLSPLLLSTLRAIVARMWPDFARAAGVPAGVGIGVGEEGRIALSGSARHCLDAAMAALGSLSERLEDDGWLVYRDMGVIPRWRIVGIVGASERDPSSPGGIARGNRLAAERARRHGPRRAAMGDPRGAKYAHTVAGNRMASGGSRGR